MCYVSGNFKSLYHYTAAVYPPPYDKRKETDYIIVTMDSTAKITIQYDCKVDSVCIRPLSAKLKYEYSENQVTIMIERPVNFSVEINNSIENNVIVFADYEKSYKLDDYDHVISFAQGVHYADNRRQHSSFAGKRGLCAWLYKG